MLFIKTIIEEDLTNKNGEDIETTCTELPQVKQAIDAIDGKNKTAVILKKDGENLMIIGGGQNGKFIVTAHLKGKAWHMANKFQVNKDPVELVVGGKAGTYAAKRCLNLEMVLEAAKHFADRGALAQTFDWETR